MHKPSLRGFLTVGLFLLTLSSAYSQDAETIISRFARTLNIPDIQGSFTVRMIAADGDTREVKARAYQKLIADSQNNRLFVFNYPPRVRGTAILLHSYTDGRENNMWIYLPAIRRVKRIALGTSGSGYFMGSDFTYQDLINVNTSQMDIEKLPDTDVNGKECWVLRYRGMTAEQRRESGYSHIKSFFNQENSVIIRREYYDLSGKLLKVYTVHELLDLDPYYYPTRISMTNVQTGHRSVITVDEISTDPIPERRFTVRYLRNSD